MAEEKVKLDKVEVDGLGTVEVDMGQAEVFRLDQEDWDDQHELFGPSDDGGGDWEAEGGGQRWIPEADGADQAVEQYWEARGRSPSQVTDLAEADELDGDGAGTEDADMRRDLGDGGGYCAANSVNIEEVPAYTHAFNARAEGAIRICKEKV